MNLQCNQRKYEAVCRSVSRCERLQMCSHRSLLCACDRADGLFNNVMNGVSETFSSAAGRNDFTLSTSEYTALIDYDENFSSPVIIILIPDGCKRTEWTEVLEAVELWAVSQWALRTIDRLSFLLFEEELLQCVGRWEWCLYFCSCVIFLSQTFLASYFFVVVYWNEMISMDLTTISLAHWRLLALHHTATICRNSISFSLLSWYCWTQQVTNIWLAITFDCSLWHRPHEYWYRAIFHNSTSTH